MSPVSSRQAAETTSECDIAPLVTRTHSKSRSSSTISGLLGVVAVEVDLEEAGGSIEGAGGSIEGAIAEGLCVEEACIEGACNETFVVAVEPNIEELRGLVDSESALLNSSYV